MKRAIIAGLLCSSTLLMGQGVLGVGNFIHVVGNLDRSIEFYRDGLGLEMTGAPGPRAFSANAVVSSLYDAPGAQSRVASFKLPDSAMAVEIVEFQGLNAPPVKPRYFDPGAITLTIPVKDLDATETRLHRLKDVEWISASRTAGVKVRDPDGIFVNLAKQAAGVGMGITVEDAAKTAQFYEQALGFAGSVSNKGDRAALRVPGDEFPVSFSAPGYADRKAVHSAIHDPGSGVLRLRVSDFDGAVRALTAAGGTIVSAGGQPVNLGRNRAVIVRDPNNLFVQVLESAPAAGQTAK